jgi:hypothetical protein
MRLTASINSREALPVRAIPYVAGWEGHTYSPDFVADSLAGNIGRPFRRLDVVAYRLVDDKPHAVAVQDWQRIAAALNGLAADLHEKRPTLAPSDDHAGYAEWMRSAVQMLPAGVFVWLDEFLKSREDDQKLRSKHRLDDLPPIEYSPLLDDYTRASIMDGFVSISKDGFGNKACETANSSTSDFRWEVAHTNSPDAKDVDQNTDGMVAWQAEMLKSWQQIIAADADTGIRTQPTSEVCMQANQLEPIAAKVAKLTIDPPKRERRATDFLSYQQLEDEYPGTIKSGTAAVWVCKQRYGFHLLITMVGNKPRIRRDRWEGFLESRTACKGRPSLPGGR